MFGLYVFMFEEDIICLMPNASGQLWTLPLRYVMSLVYDVSGKYSNSVEY